MTNSRSVDATCEFTVITVVRNDLEGIIKTRYSLESQNYRKWKHVIIDACSNDGTGEHIASLSHENTLVLREPDSGIYDAMNKGWKISEPNSYLIYLNAGDVFAEKISLSAAAAALKKAGYPNWGCTTHEERSSDGALWICKLVSQPSIRNQLFATGYRSHQGVIMKRSFVERLGGFNENLKIAADWDLIVKAMIDSSPAIWSIPLSCFELGGYSSQHILQAHHELAQLRKQYIRKNASFRMYEYLWMGLTLRSIGYSNFVTKMFNAFLFLQDFIANNLLKVPYLLNLVVEFLGKAYRRTFRRTKSNEIKNKSKKSRWVVGIYRLFSIDVYGNAQRHIRKKLDIN
jgi:glycosyltransferase involved in cell wall biosynthesis